MLLLAMEQSGNEGAFLIAAAHFHGGARRHNPDHSPLNYALDGFRVFQLLTNADPVTPLHQAA
ncbi:hypothetical protein SDC9_211242 [bioreactor metagenome]|uniref:Uncharacterized protein n=1 Tax=bioreactor metagenome TaxID=1076179 RepID=A0A645JWA8_9ZZZZ